MHTGLEISAQVLVEGDFERSSAGEDNSQLVAADTVRNAVYVMAEILQVLRKAKGGHLKKLKTDL